MLFNLLAQAFPAPQDPDGNSAALQHSLRQSSWWPRLQRLCAATHCEGLTRAVLRPRIRLLETLAQLLEREREALAKALAEDGGRSLQQCRLEAERSVQTVRLAAECVQSLAGGALSDLSDAVQPGASFARRLRFPIGAVGAIVPFNFPLNLGLHKLAPAIALGVPFVCKPPSSSVRAFELLNRLLLEAGLAEESFAIIFAPNEIVTPLFATLALPVVSFTGSRVVGEALRKALPDRRVLLELGSTAACIVDSLALQGESRHKILRDLTRSAFAGAGQSCISLQHLLVPAALAQAFFSEWTQEILNFVGEADPRLHPHEHPAGFCPLFSLEALQKARALVDDARACGLSTWEAFAWEPALKLAAPTIVRCDWTQAPLRPHPRLFREEVFAPVVCLHAIPDEGFWEKSLAAVRHFDANLHASVYTPDLERANQAFRELGGARAVLWNLPPSWRADAMPYGGSKLDDRGQRVGALLGDEGPMQALRDFSLERLFVFPAGAG